MPVRDLTPEQLLLLEGHVRFVDVREPEEFNGPLGHLARAEPVPLALLARTVAAWPRSTPVVVICRSGVRSARGAAILAGLGFERVYSLLGGMQAYHASTFTTPDRSGS